MVQPTGDKRTRIWWASVRWIAILGGFLLVGAGCGGPEVTDEDVETTVPSASGMPYGGGPVNGTANLVEAVARPAVYNGDTVIGQGTVAEVVSERGFWLESEGNYVFTVIAERAPSPEEEGEQEAEPEFVEPEQDQISLKAGQVIQVSGELLSTDELSTLEREIDPYAARILERQDFFLLVSPNTYQVITRGVARGSMTN